jgi:DNA-binding XRE family transcriptional regulator
MSEHTKKHHIENHIFPSLTFSYEGKSYVVDNVSKEKFKDLLSLSRDDDDLVSAEQLIQEALDELPGNSENKESGYFLKSLRLRENLTQVELGEKIGVACNNISALERGNRPIGKALANKLADFFDVNYKVFL